MSEPPATTTSAPTRTRAAHRPDLGSAPFGLGVASGDPDSTSVALWTRLVDTIDAGDHVVRCTVATDAALTEVVSTIEATATAAHGHAVHVVADGLEPGSTYFYRFDVDGDASPVGRTWTLPTEPAAIRLAVTSCQHWEDGYFTAWRHVVADEPDLALQLGDAIYGRSGIRSVRSHAEGAPEDLGGFRRRWALYRSDPDLQRAMGSLPYLATWDDNEVRSNYAANAAYRRDPSDWFTKVRAAAYQAWWEHQPTRMPAPGSTDNRLGTARSVSFGSLATIWLLDGRQFRSPHVCDPVDGLPAIELCDDLDDESRTMLGAEQEAWLASGINTDSARWSIIAQATVVADWSIEIAGLGGINHDQWDGYPPARRRLLDALGATERTMILAGDVHLAAVNSVRGGDRTVTEVVTPSVSAALDDTLALGLELTIPTLDDVHHFDTTHHGYALIDIDTDRGVARFRQVDPTEPSAAAETGSAWQVDGQGRVAEA